MKLEIDKKYKFKILSGNQILHFTGVLNWIENGFFEFTDKYDKPQVFNLNNLFSWEEVNDS